ncbi:hypothetical protein UACE39S_01746 [Ureibacillus acetophenoni]
MLLNCKNEELVKYSKGTYNKEKFIQDVKDRWELTDKQIRMTYLISDLAENAKGVFSIGHSTFINMFEQRFDMKISLSSVRRFFELLSKLEVISINAAKRKNNQQSANIYIVQPQNENERPSELPEEQAHEQVAEPHNISLNNTLKNTLKEPLNDLDYVVNNIVNNETQPIENNFNDMNSNSKTKEELEKIAKEKTIRKLTDEFLLLGLSEDVILRVINEVENTVGVRNFGGYLRSALENTLYKVDVKIGNIPGPRILETFGSSSNTSFYNWITEIDENETTYVKPKKIEHTSNPLFYNWLEE